MPLMSVVQTTSTNLQTERLQGLQRARRIDRKRPTTPPQHTLSTEPIDKHTHGASVEGCHVGYAFLSNAFRQHHPDLIICASCFATDKTEQNAQKPILRRWLE